MIAAADSIRSGVATSTFDAFGLVRWASKHAVVDDPSRSYVLNGMLELRCFVWLRRKAVYDAV